MHANYRDSETPPSFIVIPGTWISAGTHQMLNGQQTLLVGLSDADVCSLPARSFESANEALSTRLVHCPVAHKTTHRWARARIHHRRPAARSCSVTTSVTLDSARTNTAARFSYLDNVILWLTSWPLVVRTGGAVELVLPLLEPPHCLLFHSHGNYVHFFHFFFFTLFLHLREIGPTLYNTRVYC